MAARAAARWAASPTGMQPGTKQAYTPAVAGPFLLQGGSGGGAVGLISNLRSYLWIPISQNSYRCASPAAGAIHTPC